MSKRSVFISYGNRDAELGERVASALKHLGFDAWLDVEMQPGENWRKAIQSAIKQSDALVIVALTPQTLSSSWMAYEVGIAEALGKRVMLLIPNKYPVTELPDDFASTPTVEIDPQAPERAAHDVASRLAAA
jgi:TIR domain-containing protein/nucleoside 2-deoxyribosyltransferase-like protein